MLKVLNFAVFFSFDPSVTTTSVSSDRIFQTIRHVFHVSDSEKERKTH